MSVSVSGNEMSDVLRITTQALWIHRPRYLLIPLLLIALAQCGSLLDDCAWVVPFTVNTTIGAVQTFAAVTTNTNVSVACWSFDAAAALGPYGYFKVWDSSLSLVTVASLESLYFAVVDGTSLNPISDVRASWVPEGVGCLPAVFYVVMYPMAAPSGASAQFTFEPARGDGLNMVLCGCPDGKATAPVAQSYDIMTDLDGPGIWPGGDNFVCQWKISCPTGPFSVVEEYSVSVDGSVDVLGRHATNAERQWGLTLRGYGLSPLYGDHYRLVCARRTATPTRTPIVHRVRTPSKTHAMRTSSPTQRQMTPSSLASLTCSQSTPTVTVPLPLPGSGSPSVLGNATTTATSSASCLPQVSRQRGSASLNISVRWPPGFPCSLDVYPVELPPCEDSSPMELGGLMCENTTVRVQRAASAAAPLDWSTLFWLDQTNCSPTGVTGDVGPPLALAGASDGVAIHYRIVVSFLDGSRQGGCDVVATCAGASRATGPLLQTTVMFITGGVAFLFLVVVGVVLSRCGRRGPRTYFEEHWYVLAIALNW